MRSGNLPPHVIFRGAGEELADVADGAVQDALAAFDGGPGDVRGEDTVFGLQEGIVAADGLGGDDVERGGGDLAAVQRVGQILLGCLLYTSRCV